MGAYESGNEFLAGVLAKLPAELQAQAKDLFGKPEAKDAIILVGDGALARPAYSKAMDDLKVKETELQGKLDNLNTWYEENRAALTEYVAIKPEYDTLKAGGKTPPADPAKPPVVTDPRKIVEEVIADQGPQFVQVSNWLASKNAQHLHMFGEPLDPTTFTNPKLGRPIVGQPGRLFSLEDAYQERYGEKVAAKAKEADEKKFNDEVTRRLNEERAKGAGQPFPLRGDASPSVLDVLATKDGTAVHTLDSAVAEYERLQGARSAST
jgi:hypothetical protein